MNKSRRACAGKRRAGPPRRAQPSIRSSVTLRIYKGLESGDDIPGREPGSLERWTQGERETAREWARELDNALAQASRHADNAVCSDVEALTVAASHDMTTAGYAFALGLLSFDRDACVLASY